MAKALLARGLDVGDRVGIWSPNCAAWVLVQYATAKVGAILVTINPAYRTHEVQYALEQSGCRMLVAATDFKTSDYRAMVAEVRPSLPGLEQVVFLGTDDWDELLAGGDVRRPTTRWRSEPRRCSPTDPINIQYTSGTTGFPKGATLSHRNILNNGYFTGEALRLHRGRPRLHPGALLPLLRDGARQPGVHHPRRRDGDPGARVRSRRHARDRRGRALHEPLRRAHDVHRRARARRLRRPTTSRSLRTGIMAGSPCPVEVMKQCVSDDAHGRGDHLLRHDRDVAGLDADRRRRPARQARRHRRAGPPPRRGEGRRRRRRAPPSAGASRASSAPAATR